MAEEPPVDPYAQFKPGARRLIEAALLAEPGTPGQAGLHNWLITLCERHGPMAESVARGLDHRAVFLQLFLLRADDQEVHDPHDQDQRDEASEGCGTTTSGGGLGKGGGHEHVASSVESMGLGPAIGRAP